MKILYGVVGEGMGHATRSRVVIDHLLASGHEVHIVASGRAQEFLHRRFPNVRGIWGYTIAYEANEVRNWQTLVQNLKGLVTGWPKNIVQYFGILESFQPDVVISDFETFSYLFAQNHRLPLISIDNMQILNRCRLDPELIAGHEADFQLGRALVKSKLPGAFHYLVTTFFRPELSKERTTLIPSILRPEILEAKREVGEHVVVYQTSTTHVALPETLKRAGVPFRIYGMRRELKEDQVEGNLTFRPFSEAGFINDLRTARAVIAGGGFTLLSEAVYLHKPILSHPVGGQFEQILNARYVEKLHYGKHAPELDERTVQEFLAQVPSYANALSSYQQDGNQELKRVLDEQLESALAKKGKWFQQEG
ncbi:MAG: teichoic acid biosynthesis protein [Myxococcota bacterium]|nr:teichoic acid biosynthesis protein [Myxococcota bacterium]